LRNVKCCGNACCRFFLRVLLLQRSAVGLIRILKSLKKVLILSGTENYTKFLVGVDYTDILCTTRN